jgi:hypothetical protein
VKASFPRPALISSCSLQKRSTRLGHGLPFRLQYVQHFRTGFNG